MSPPPTGKVMPMTANVYRDRYQEPLDAYKALLEGLEEHLCCEAEAALDPYDFYHRYGPDVVGAVAAHPDIVCHPFVRFAAQRGEATAWVEREPWDGKRWSTPAPDGDVYRYETDDLSEWEFCHPLEGGDATHLLFPLLSWEAVKALREAWRPSEGLGVLEDIEKGWGEFIGEQPEVVSEYRPGELGTNGGYAVGYVDEFSGFARARISREVYPTPEEARAAIEAGDWQKLDAPFKPAFV